MNTDLEDAVAEALRARAGEVPHAPMPQLGRRTRRAWLAPVAAAAVVVVAAAVTVVVLSGGNDAPAPVATPPTATAPSTVLAPGEVYYSVELTRQGGGPVIREFELWQPPERTGEWRQHLVFGQSIKDGHVVPAGQTQYPPGGVCFPAREVTDDNCTMPGAWSNPTVDFLATAPRDPETIMDQIHASVLADGAPEDLVPLRELYRVKGVLSSNGVPPALASALREVTAALPGVIVTEHMANLTGERGTGYSYPTPGAGLATIIFDADGHYIGSPTESVHHGVAPALGEPPSRMLD